MRSKIMIASATLAALAWAGAAVAEDVVIEPDKTEPLRLRNEAASIILGNPDVADVAVHSNRLLLVTGRRAGRTNLIVLDKSDREIFSGDIIVSNATGNRVRVQRNANVSSYECIQQCRPVEDQPDPAFGADLGGQGQR